MLCDDLGMFSDERVSTPDVLARFSRRLVAHTPIRGDTRVNFEQRWDGVLEGADDVLLQLAGELLWLHLLFPSDITAARKRRMVTDTLALRVEPLEMPGELRTALGGGLARTGIAYKARRLSQLQLVTDAALDIKHLPPGARRRLLADPWEVKQWLEGVPTPAAQSQREVLAHLLHPATFEPIATPELKQRIIATFSAHVPAGVDDADLALAAIRSALAAQHGRTFFFTDAALEARWRTEESG